MIGTTLGHYRILKALGSGGMGEVFAAEDLTLGRRVAIKILPAAMATDPDRRSRFEHEARAVAALNHPNIVTIHSVETAAAPPFLTMELVEGALWTTCSWPHRSSGWSASSGRISDGVCHSDAVRLNSPACARLTQRETSHGVAPA